jgi:hypothetical protein
MKAKFPGQALHIFFNEEQLEVLASVACNDVYASMLPNEALAIREIAADLGKSAGAVGAVIPQPIDAGLVITAGTRRRRSRTEQLYTMSSMSGSISPDGYTPEVAQLLNKQFRGNMRAAERYQSKYTEARGIDNSFRLFGYYVWSSVYLSPENSLKIRDAMASVHDLINQLGESDPENRTDDSHVRVRMTTMMFPSVKESKKITDK